MAPVYVWTVAKRSVSRLCTSARFVTTGEARDRPLRAKTVRCEKRIMSYGFGY
jgi:hypothetical protein